LNHVKSGIHVYGNNIVYWQSDTLFFINIFVNYENTINSMKV